MLDRRLGARGRASRALIATLAVCATALLGAAPSEPPPPRLAVMDCCDSPAISVLGADWQLKPLVRDRPQRLPEAHSVLASVSSLGGWSDDGKRFSYVVNDVAGLTVRSVGADGRGDGEVASLPGWWPLDAAVAPRGPWVAVSASPPWIGWWTVPVPSLWLVSTESGVTVPLGPVAGPPSWSRKGNRVAFSTPVGELLVVDIGAAGPGAPERVDTPGLVAYAPALSPSGTTIAFLASTDAVASWFSGESAEIATVGVGGSSVRRLGARSWYAPSWSPDGKSLAYTTSGGSVGTVKQDGTGKRTVRFAAHAASTPTWSADGRWLGYVSSPPACCATSVELVSADGRTRRTVTTDRHGGLTLAFTR